MVLGARPQAAALARDGNAILRGRVWVVELLGSEKLVEVDLGGKRRFTVQVRADAAVGLDEAIGVRLDPASVHIFDAETGVVVRPEG